MGRTRMLLTSGISILAMLGLAVRLLAQQPGGPPLPPPRAVTASGQQPGNAGARAERLPPIDARPGRQTPIRPAIELRIKNVNAPPGSGSHGPRIDEQPTAENLPAPKGEQIVDTRIPSGFVPWWQAAALQRFLPSSSPIPVDVSSLIVESLRYSARVQAISDNVVIAETAITRAAAEFDAHAFMESKFIRTSIPTGSTLDAGFDVPRLRDGNWTSSAGIRKKNEYGGRAEIAQRLGTEYSNSEFFFPENQGSAQLTLRYNQPLLNGAGKAYNTSLIVLAKLDTRIAADQTAADLQDHLLEVTGTFWQLYLQRATLLQKQRHLQRAELIYTRLERRREVDALDSQILRARAAVALRRTELIRAATAIRNAESTLRALVNSPDMLADRQRELVPIQAPLSHYLSVDAKDSLVTALDNRPEINAVTQEIEAARVRLGVARNELLPVLDAVLETSVNGLRGNYNVAQSLVDQFSVGEPSYTAGLVFEFPLGQRAATATNTRRQAELRQLSSRFQATVERVSSEVEIASREVDTAYREMQANYQSMLATDSDMRYCQRRWEELPGDDRAASLLLDDLLDSQNRLALAERAFAQSQVDYTLSLTRLNRALGTLLTHEQISWIRGREQGLPKIRFEKRARTVETLPPVGHD